MFNVNRGCQFLLGSLSNNDVDLNVIKCVLCFGLCLCFFYFEKDEKGLNGCNVEVVSFFKYFVFCVCNIFRKLVYIFMFKVFYKVVVILIKSFFLNLY